jgi:hypothetical protein
VVQKDRDFIESTRRDIEHVRKGFPLVCQPVIVPHIRNVLGFFRAIFLNQALSFGALKSQEWFLVILLIGLRELVRVHSQALFARHHDLFVVIDKLEH